MSWFLVDDNLEGNPKFVRLLNRPQGLSAIGLWTVCGSWARRFKTGGFVSDDIVIRCTRVHGQSADGFRTLADASDYLSVADELVGAELWTRVPGGYQFHDWNEVYRAESKELERKQKDAARKRAERAAQKASNRPRTQVGQSADSPRTVQGTPGIGTWKESLGSGYLDPRLNTHAHAHTRETPLDVLDDTARQLAAGGSK